MLVIWLLFICCIEPTPHLLQSVAVPLLPEMSHRRTKGMLLYVYQSWLRRTCNRDNHRHQMNIHWLRLCSLYIYFGGSDCLRIIMIIIVRQTHRSNRRSTATPHKIPNATDLSLSLAMAHCALSIICVSARSTMYIAMQSIAQILFRAGYCRSR